MSRLRVTIAPAARRPWPRRRVLCLAAAACGLPLLGPPSRRPSPDRSAAFQWRGIALGARAQITLLHPDGAAVRRILRVCLDEIARLDSVFNLHNAHAELTRLNRQGRLRAASLDLRLLLEESQRLGHLTGGAFDVTVQPLWRLYARHFRAEPGDAAGPPPQTVDRARARVDYRQLDIGGRGVGFLRPGMAATLNGIAQGYITDRIAGILRDQGYDRVLVNLGEIAALGAPANPGGWPIRVDDPLSPGRALGQVTLTDRAIATSAGVATRFDTAGRHHHLFDPATGRSAAHHRAVSVVSDSATLSDALSTALSVLPNDTAPSVLRKAGAERALIAAADGTVQWISGT